MAGFPWHPHRGIETVTYMLDGFVEHEDSIGNKGVIGGGDVQWMTAGSGIIHQEMPKPRNPEDGFMGGFQLWVNLPKAQKMTDPRYQEVQRAGIPEVEPVKGVRVRVISGEVGGVRGPVRDIAVDPEYLDVRLAPGAVFEHPVKRGHTSFSYVLQGRGRFDLDSGIVDSENLVTFRDGDRVRVEGAGDDPLRFLLITGRPIREPVAWWGPIVMNTKHELDVAIQEYQEGTFLKHADRRTPPT
jgi:redox-sensitive bicupin YhaK (pirin superfamily)